MERNCPKCGKHLTEHALYFCSSCGSKLEEQQINYVPDFKVNITFLADNKKSPENSGLSPSKSSKVILKSAIIVILVLLVLAPVFVVSKRVLQKTGNAISNKNSQQQTSTVQVKTYLNTIDNSVVLKSGNFGENEITKFIPFDTDFYLEGYDIVEAEKLITLPDYIQNTIIAFSNDATGHFALFGMPESDKKWKLGLVFGIKSDADYEDKLKSLKLYDLTIERIGDYVLLTNYKDYVQTVKETSGSIARNVSHNPKFSSYNALLRRDGKIIFMLFKDDDTPLFYELIKDFNPQKNLSGILDEIQAKKYNKFVIK